MAARHSALFERELTVTYTDITGILAVAVAVHSTDGTITAVGATFLLLFAFCIPLTVAEYLSVRSRDS
ncbi:hypothetical protein [Natrinema halophilum]|uniref:Uncharacterized protein n=1 Tax=Natrinema halophilum TaxID=1699371 RepID=A0A7D5KLT0_9EURY|nr:hypothetical protein [Natrinema halophilum]QLG50218.1 hypothetical protein HYG82_15845 [Natrinema halophilum]